jgi:hypothetical protein
MALPVFVGIIWLHLNLVESEINPSQTHPTLAKLGSAPSPGRYPPTTAGYLRFLRIHQNIGYCCDRRRSLTEIQVNPIARPGCHARAEKIRVFRPNRAFQQ